MRVMLLHKLAEPGQRFRPSCAESVTYRASVPASPPHNAGSCPEKRVAETVAVTEAILGKRRTNPDEWAW
jgi:hypothetical protein